MEQTKVDAELEEREAAFSDDAERAGAIACARRFKSSWVELAEVLVSLRKTQRYKAWGFETFEAYTTKELRLRQETVDKLSGSYAFLKRRAPTVLDRDGVARSIPSYQAIDFLRRAEEESDATPDVVHEIRKQVIEECAPVPQIKRQFGEVVFPLSSGERKKKDQAAIKNVATRLRDLLGDTSAVSRRLSTELRELLDRVLEEVANESATNEEAAA